MAPVAQSNPGGSPDQVAPVGNPGERARLTGEPFAAMYRIIDANGFDHIVLIVGEGGRDHNGDVVTVNGYITDRTTRVEVSYPN